MPKHATTTLTCRVYHGSHLVPFVHLGSTPLADRFLATPDEPEERFPLDVRVCADCFLVQLVTSVDPSLLFGEDYGFYTGASASAVTHFAREAAALLARFPDQAAFTVEIASNDGELLRHFQQAGNRVLGIDPATPPAQAAIARGIPTLVRPFDARAARTIVATAGEAGLVLANNVLAHVADPVAFARGVTEVLRPGGVFVFEVQYLPHLLFRTEFDHIYHEHHSYFSFGPIERLLAQAALRVFDVQHVPTQGGSLRVFACPLQARQRTTAAVALLREQERALALDTLATYAGFAPRVAYLKEQLLTTLTRLKRAGKHLAGFGANAKSCTLLNYCGIDADLLDYVLDGTPAKYGRYTPGTPFNDLSVPTDIVFLVVLWRLRYKLSLRDLAEMFGERGFVFSHETVRAWEALVAPLLTKHLRARRGGKAGVTWHTDET